jgi:hypothetical protein
MAIDLFNKLVAVVSHPRLDIPYDEEADAIYNFQVGLQNIESFGLRLGMLAGYVRIALSFWASRTDQPSYFYSRLIEMIRGIDSAFIPSSMMFIYLLYKDRIERKISTTTFTNVQWLANTTFLASGTLTLLSLAGIILSNTRFDMQKITRHAYTVAVPAIATCLMSAYIGNYILAQLQKINEANQHE